jgi:hypothetical protein
VSALSELHMSHQALLVTSGLGYRIGPCCCSIDCCCHARQLFMEFADLESSLHDQARRHLRGVGPSSMLFFMLFTLTQPILVSPLPHLTTTQAQPKHTRPPRSHNSHTPASYLAASVRPQNTRGSGTQLLLLAMAWSWPGACAVPPARAEC